MRRRPPSATRSRPPSSPPSSRRGAADDWRGSPPSTREAAARPLPPPITAFDHWLWLLGQAWSFAVYLWHGSLLAIVGFALAFWRVPDRSKRRFRRLATLTAILWAVDVLVLALGQGLEQAPVGPLGLEALWWLWALVAVEPLLALLLVARAGRGLRLRTVGLVLPPTWFLLCCYLIAAMSVTGDWI